MTRLDGASVLVLGATGGLGAPLSRRLADAGALLTLVARDGDRLAALGLDGAALAPADLAEPGAADRVVDAAVAAHGRLDGVVHLAGVVAFGPAGEVTDETLERLLTMNLLSPVRVLRAALPHLAAAGAEADRGPFVVHVSAVVAELPTAGMAAYSASKAALTAFDAAAGRELRRAKVRLLDARPPHTETGLTTRAIAGEAPRMPAGLDPDAVAARIVAAIEADERDLPSSAFSAT